MRNKTYRKPRWAVSQTVRESGLVEDVCSHGVGHPNKEWLETHPNRDHLGIHGCDGCCRKKGVMKKKPVKSLHESMRWTNNMLMVTAAHRYCLGRETYIVGSCIEWLTEIWELVDRNTQNVIMRDTIAALMDGEAGSPYIDEPAWRRFCEASWGRISPEQQAWVRDALRHKDKPWPLTGVTR